MTDMVLNSDEVLWGAKAIAEVLGISTAKVLHRLAKGQLPARKVGATWTTTRSALTRFLEVAP